MNKMFFGCSNLIKNKKIKIENIFEFSNIDNIDNFSYENVLGEDKNKLLFF